MGSILKLFLFIGIAATVVFTNPLNADEKNVAASKTNRNPSMLGNFIMNERADTEFQNDLSPDEVACKVCKAVCDSVQNLSGAPQEEAKKACDQCTKKCGGDSGGSNAGVPTSSYSLMFNFVTLGPLLIFNMYGTC